MAYVGFEAIERSAAKSGARNPAAVAAKAGFAKYGKKKMLSAARYGKEHPGSKPMLAPK